MKNKCIYLILSLMFLCGCNNLYYDTYIGQTAPIGKFAPALFDGNDPKMDHEAFQKKGYKMIGYSMIVSSKSYKKLRRNALEQAKEVNADMVLFYASFYGRETSTLALPTTTYSTSNTNFSGNTYGNYSNKTGSFNGTATTGTWTHGTDYVPITKNYSKSLTTYWVKPGRIE